MKWKNDREHYGSLLSVYCTVCTNPNATHMFACETWKYIRITQKRKWLCRMAIRRCAEYILAIRTYVRSFVWFCSVVCAPHSWIYDLYTSFHLQFWFCLLRLVIRFCDLERNIRCIQFFVRRFSNFPSIVFRSVSFVTDLFILFYFFPRLFVRYFSNIFVCVIVVSVI